MMRKIIFIFILVLFSTSNVNAKEQQVEFNTETYKYHKISCRWAKKCTVNCIRIDKKEAIKQGGVPCKVCGG